MNARLKSLLVVALAVLALLLVAAQSALAVAETDWLGRINEIRAGSGLPAVTENPAWTAGIQAHLHYLTATPHEYEVGEYASAHTENPSSPYYTPEGAAEAGRSDLVSGGTSSPVGAIDVWLTAPFHAIGMLRPALTQVAFGRDPASGAAGLDIIGGLGSGEEVPRDVLFPGNGSTIDLNRFGGESPTPIETCEAEHPGISYSSAGLPLIAMLTADPEPGVAAALQSPSGATVTSAGSELCIVTAENFVSSDAIYGPTGREILESDHAVLVIPRQPLVAGTYTVAVTQPAQAALTWSFTDAPPPGTQPVTTVGRESTVGPKAGRRGPAARVGVHFGTPHFPQAYVPVLLTVHRNAPTTAFRVKSIGPTRTFKVPGGHRLRVRVHLRRRGVTRVSVKADGRTVGRRRILASY